MDQASFELELKNLGLSEVQEAYKIMNFKFRTNARRARQGEILKFRPVQTTTLGVLSQGMNPLPVYAKKKKALSCC
jgi:hypothetical protein